MVFQKQIKVLRDRMKQIYEKYKQLMPLGILILFSFSAVFSAITGQVEIAGETQEFELLINHYLALLAIILNIIVYFKYRQYYKYTLPLTIFIGLFNLIIFSALESRSFISFGTIEIGGQPASLLAGITLYIINFEKINKAIFKVSDKKNSNKEVVQLWQEDIEKFKDKYQKYSTEALNHIVLEKRFVPEAIEAARQILQERNSKQSTNL